MKLSTILTQQEVPEVFITGVSIDTRTIEKGQLFIAIKGENFDGHNFIQAAELAGAVAVICERKIIGVSISQILVKDSLQTLALMASAYREQIQLKVIALTGSNGKTSVKEMISHILPEPYFATKGNLNNHIGVPLCVLKLKPTDKYAVFELGASHIGEIAYTANIVKPDVALINNIAPAHIEGFGSIDGVARAKGEIYESLSSAGVAVVNDDDYYANFWNSIISDKKTIRFSRKMAADIYAENIVFSDTGFVKFNLICDGNAHIVKLRVPGVHNVSNALAAAACTYAAGIELEKIISGLESFTGVAGRVTFKTGKKKSVIIDDTYNANLRSSLTALDVLSARAGYRVLVFGDMGELGLYTKDHHQKVGLAAREAGIDLVLTCGKHSEDTSKAFGRDGMHFSDKKSLVSELLPKLNENTTVLVKGSRSAAMEEIVNELGC